MKQKLLALWLVFIIVFFLFSFIPVKADYIDFYQENSVYTEQTLFNYNNTNEISGHNFYQYVRWSSSFVASANYTILSTKLYLERIGNTQNTISVSIRNADANGVPVGNDLSTGYLSNLNVSTNGLAWYRVGLSPINLVAGQYYAIICSMPTSDVANYINWPYSTSQIAGKAMWSIDSGNTWNDPVSQDMYFEIYGNLYSSLQVVTKKAYMGENLPYIQFGGNVTSLNTPVTQVGIRVARVADNYSSGFSITQNVTYTTPQTWTQTIAVSSLNLINNQVYKYHAFAVDSVTSVNGSDLGFTWIVTSPIVYTISHTSSIINGKTVVYLTGNITSASSNYSVFEFRGFQFGTVAGNYNLSLSLSQGKVASIHDTNWPLAWDGTSGEFTLWTDQLSANTTYYYRAFCSYQSSIAGIMSNSYGEEKSFTTAGLLGTDKPILNLTGLDITNNKLNVGVYVSQSSSAPLANIGFYYGIVWSTGNTIWYAGATKATSSLGQHLLTSNFDYPSLPIGSTYYVYAWAQDTLDNIGYSNQLSNTLGGNIIGTGGLTVTNTGVTINENVVTITASINNPSNSPITMWQFAWGLTSFGLYNNLIPIGESIQISNTGSNPETISYLIRNLDLSANYHYSSAVYSNGVWTWATNIISFTTGSVAITSYDIPAVLTLTGTNIGLNYFTANGNLTSIGDANVTQLGFAWRTTVDSIPVTDWSKSLTNGNFSPGTFSKQLSFTQNSITVYYCAVAVNQFGIAYGIIYHTNLASSGIGGTGGTRSAGGTGGAGETGSVSPGSSGPNTTQGFAQVVDNLASIQGLESSSGRWAVLGEILILVSFAFILFIVASKDDTLKKIIAVCWCIMLACIVGAFVFTGTLGIWPIVILASATVLLIFVVGGVIIKGRSEA